jgi:Uma2 family endonuclease
MDNDVREYWIADAERQRIVQYKLMDGGDYDIPVIYTFQDRVPSLVLDGFFVDFSEIELS